MKPTGRLMSESAWSWSTIGIPTASSSNRKWADDLVGARAPPPEERRQRHHRGGAQAFGLQCELDHDPARGVVDGGDHRHASRDLLDPEAEQLALFRLREQVPFRGVREHHQAVRTAANAELDEAPFALEVERTVGPEAGGEDRKDAAQRR